MAERLRIIQGSDKKIVIRIRLKSGDPYDLSLVTGFQVVLESKDRGKVTLTDSTIPATKAIAKSGNITFTAQTAGKNGNGIVLAFNGVDTINDVVTAWNTANPSNQVTHNTSTPTTVLSAQTLRLTGGYDNYRPVEVFGNPLLGKIIVTMLEKDTAMLKVGPNQSVKIVLDEGLDTGGNRVMGYFENKLDVIGV